MYSASLNTIANQFGIIHFIGIGGIGMSGIAEILHNLGCKVQGSDLNMNAQVKHLQDLGIPIMIGHEASNIKNASVVIRSSAVKMDNPEIIEAKNKKLPIIQRAEMLAELMRFKISVAVAGTHGKTTTTSLIAALFETAGLEPTVVNGGIINSKQTNAYLGAGDYLIAEADESDGTFTKLPATIAVITNINADHLDFYGDYANVKKAFRNFIENIPFYGFAVLCNDHPEVKKLAEEITDRKVLTYALDNEADIVATNIKIDATGAHFDLQISNNIPCELREIKGCYLPVMGKHNIQNCLAALTIGLQLGFDIELIQKAFANFKGVKRRFTLTGEVNNIKIVDDYAHHPEEIKATLLAAKDVANITKGKIIAVFQPHRYTRLNNLFNDFVTAFNTADKLFVTEIYTAGEKPIEDINHLKLIKEINNHNTKLQAEFIPDINELAKQILNIASPGDIVLHMGAGSITQWAQSLPAQLITLKNS
ncbi:UDP-N-acetylmuramate--L-alanine ligase [Rickettsiales endosymbiont of Stachyamoeba lipophora]|uniref:UDP-N-acetylmuramate--L-alanine ligase n=1 Tax=Rickettsiales endosymbiont of Stachyamoeba lipophora TaxID=2486578 RepID=UPI000F6538F0|nr:UDP-N-acetylmuramate--L-alanine ligase [Rickettsiales endosymbiont of Stachyamoeba lipophora]AZL15462.1 UDP-N-acetylmuramate--L-alanine ligase [Rickettsiales endosymbiont of Stachyamoeba lipophora]